MTAAAATQRQVSARPRIALWLLSVCGLIAIMVVIGGLTRLTGSGLSITEWKPIHGALPPLSLDEWNEEFLAYKQIPQYQILNKGMTLDEFKEIFWWEWGHRNLGRLIGIAFLIPFLVFLATRRVERALVPRLGFLFVLGGMQGFMGWYMVMSGLTERVDVSQYRLVAHLGLALVIYSALLWTALPLLRGAWPPVRTWGGEARWPVAFAGLVFLQILLGGFVAGLDAGLTYNTWPLMDGAFVPEGAYPAPAGWRAPFEDVTTVQFNHRMMAYLVCIAAGIVAYREWKVAGRLSTTMLLVLAALGAQMVIGIATLLAVVPLWLAALHQFGAVVLLTAALVHADARTRAVAAVAAPRLVPAAA